MNLIESVESQIRATLDKYAFEINVCVQDQAQNNRYDQLMLALEEYAKAASRLEVLEKVKSQIQDVHRETTAKETNED